MEDEEILKNVSIYYNGDFYELEYSNRCKGCVFINEDDNCIIPSEVMSAAFHQSNQSIYFKNSECFHTSPFYFSCKRTDCTEINF